ncbi:GNAT family N-acetyltransferase [Pendulispora brunnea]|uniref:GNAT family N-acetyltransferase n=1 Tax=Pendulispora brunnea TaxID=2905690 RepID=A0ABZ2KCY1_9BACT
MTVHTDVVSSLASYSDAELDRVTEDANVALGRHWFRLLDALDLGPLVGETVRIQYVVARQNGELVAVCPFFIAVHPSVRFVNSFEKAFFTGMEDELRRATKVTPEQLRWLMRALGFYRQLLRMVRVRTDGWVIAVSPLTFRGGIPTTPMVASERRRVQTEVLERLKDVAGARNLPLALFCVPEEDEPLRETARACGMAELFLTYDMYIPLSGKRIEDYIAAQPPRRRKRGKLQREIKAPQRTGVTVGRTSNWAALSSEMTESYEALYSQYGDHFGHPPAFWESLEHHLGDRAEALVAHHDGEFLGFSTYFHDKKGDLTVYRVGRRPIDKADGIYFNLVFYEPIKRAYELGCRRVWVGTGAFDTKLHRGASGHPLYGYIWMPTQRARLLLLPYMQRLTDYVSKQLHYVGQPATDDAA